MNIARVLSKDRMARYGSSFKYIFYTMFHPFDGFWCITREKRGSIAVANTIVIGMVITEILRRTLTNFQFHIENMERFNSVLAALSIAVPFLLWALSNWSLTTLMDGKGRLKDIYMGTAYAFAPYWIVNLIMIPFSHVISFQENVLYYIIINFALGWSVLLTLAAMMQIHDYSLAKTVFSSLLTIVGILIIIFIFMLFFSLISDGIAYFVSIYRELLFRFL